MTTSRRRFVGTLAAAGAGALLAQRVDVGADLQVRPDLTARPRRVDFHHHFQLAEIMAIDARAGAPPPTVPWTMARDLEDMDRFGTETAILSGFVPTRGDIETRRKGARILNDFAAKVHSDYPARFGVLAALPLRDFDNDGCLREIEYAGDNPRNGLSGDQVLQQLRRFYYDTAQSSNPVAMDALKKVVGVPQIMFGTDYWYRTAEETGRGLVSSGVFTAAELQAIDRGNAERLIPRLRSLAPKG